ncbi:MAG: tetratricopeptide repeat protein [Spirochaetaceae bacterium]|nr:tetratricopeptide repeat protein [Spirochaetaceae bacterium]
MRSLLVFLLLLLEVTLFSQSSADDLFINGREAFSSKSYDSAVVQFIDFLEMYPDDPRADGVNYMLSVSYFYLKRYFDSIDSFKLFKGKYSDSAYNSRVSYWLGLCSYALKNYSDASSYFLKQTEFKDESFFVSRSFLYLGESYEKLSFWEKAKEAYRSGIISGGEERIISMSRLKLGILYYNSRDFIKAKEQFTEVLNNSIDSAIVSDSQYYVGECLYNMGDLRNAASKLQYYLFMNTNNKFREAAIFRLGDIYQSLNMSDEAVKYLELLKSDYPDGNYYLDGLRVLAATYRSVKELDKASEIIEEIIQLTSDDIEKQNSYFELAQIKIDSQNPLDAIVLLKKASEGSDETIVEISLYYLGQLLLDNNREDEGAAYLFELINRFPDGDTTDDASLTLSEFLIKTGDTHRLTLFVGSQLNRNGLYQDRFLLLKGELDEDQGNYDEAIFSYDRLINEYPDSDYFSSAVHRKAKIYMKEGKTDEVLPLLDTALTRSVKEEETINILVDKAILLYKMGQWDQADNAFKVLLENDKDFPRKEEILYSQGELLMTAREYGAAAEYFRRAAEAGYGEYSNNALFKMGKCYYFDLNYKTSERIYSDLSEKLSSTPDKKFEAMKMTALSIFLQREWSRTLQYTDLMVTSLGVYPSEIRLLKLLSLLALNRDDMFKKELDSLNVNQKDNQFIKVVFNQLEKTDFNSVILIFRSLLSAYPQEGTEKLLALLITDMIYITSDEEWIEETYTLLLPYLDDEVDIIGFKQAYEMNKSD